MKLLCEVETVFILAQASGCACKNQKARASLTIGRKPESDEVLLVVSTVKNVAGIKYKIRDNIKQIFSRFIKDGRVTVRFNEPAHDLSISNADPVKLKQFLALLKLSPTEQSDVSVDSIARPTKKDLEKPQKKLIVKSRGDYPMSGFPSSLESIEAVNINLNRIDKRIFNLSCLQSLDLSDNSIKVIPDEIATLRLVELKLGGNKISELPVRMCHGALTNTLRTLDVSRNGLAFLPSQFHHFRNLVTLHLECNELQVLPRTFGKMSTLRFLFASSNKLVVLPHSFSSLKLESLDLFNNSFRASGLVRRCHNLSLPTLVEIAGRAVKKYKLSYNPETLPVILCHYLDSAKKCLCGTACLEAYLHYIASLSLHKVSAIVVAIDQVGSTSVPVELFLCSAKCLKLWNHYK